MADRKEQRALLAGLEALLQEYEIETQLSEGENLLVLRARFNGLGTADGTALMEICEYPFTVGEGEPMRLRNSTRQRRKTSTRRIWCLRLSRWSR